MFFQDTLLLWSLSCNINPIFYNDIILKISISLCIISFSSLIQSFSLWIWTMSHVFFTITTSTTILSKHKFWEMHCQLLSTQYHGKDWGSDPIHLKSMNTINRYAVCNFIKYASINLISDFVKEIVNDHQSNYMYCWKSQHKFINHHKLKIKPEVRVTRQVNFAYFIQRT